MKESVQRITLAMPRPLLRKMKILAVKRQTSVSALLTGLLKEIVERQNAYASARERALVRLERPVNLGTRGQVTWTRDSLHER